MVKLLLLVISLLVFHFPVLAVETAAKVDSLSKEMVSVSGKQSLKGGKSTYNSVTETAETNLKTGEKRTKPKVVGEHIVPFTSAKLKYFTDRFDHLITEVIDIHEKQLNADSLYQELNSFLQQMRISFGPIVEQARYYRDPISSGGDNQVSGETVQEYYKNLIGLAKLRIELLKEISPQLRTRLTGMGKTGGQELKGEINLISLHLRYQLLVAPEALVRTSKRFSQAPLPFIGNIIATLLVLFAFYFWRTWAKEGIPRIRNGLLAKRPRIRINIRKARLFWYLDQIRTPLEWLILIEAIFYFVHVDFQWLSSLLERLWIIPLWIFVAWFLVSLINAVATRGGPGLLGDNPVQRIRTLRLLATWLLLAGLGLDLAEAYSGQGTLYHWVLTSFKLLSIPVLFLILIWWRPIILETLGKNIQTPEWVQSRIKYQRGFKSYLGAAVGGIYLIARYLLRYLYQILILFGWGKQLMSNYYQQQVLSDSGSAQLLVDGTPITVETKIRITKGNDEIIKTFASKELKSILDKMEKSESGNTMIVGERGVGKSTMLKRLVSLSKHKTLIVDCPMGGGYQAFLDAFAGELGISSDSIYPDAFVKQLVATDTKVVCIDNYHRLARPNIGGLKDIETVGQMLQDIDAPIHWIKTLDRESWKYIIRAHGHMIMRDIVTVLPNWEEDDIDALIDLSAKRAGITPDFEQLSFPLWIDDTDEMSLEERNRVGFSRLLCQATEGNPELVLLWWADSLIMTPDQRFVVVIAEQTDPQSVQDVNMTVLFVLRVIIQCEFATQEDIINSLNMSETVIKEAIHFSRTEGWIEKINDHYRVTWRWYRTITKALTYKNMLNLNT